jgi:hypothetical protein
MVLEGSVPWYGALRRRDWERRSDCELDFDIASNLSTLLLR